MRSTCCWRAPRALGSVAVAARRLRAVHRQHRPQAAGSPSTSSTLSYEALSSTEPDSASSSEELNWESDIVPFTGVGQSTRRVQALPDSPPIVLLPGFGNCTADYTEGLSGQKDDSIVSALEARGFRVFVLPVERKSWLNVAKALLKPGFWSSSLTTDPGYTWYLKLIHETVERAVKETGATQVDLVAHSAGGWLARAYIGDPTFLPRDTSGSGKDVNSGGHASSVPAPPKSALARLTAALPSLPPMLLTLPSAAAATSSSNSGNNSSSSSSSSDTERDGSKQQAASTNSVLPAPRPNPRVRTLVTLGTPQRPIPPEKGRDATGGALRWVHETYPGAFFAESGVRYVSVGGRTVRGNRQPGEDTKGPRTPPQYAFDSYGQVCGDGRVLGDAVVPVHYAFLGGAQRHILLDGVWHSMSQIGTFDKDSGVVWYGSDAVVDAWLWTLVDPLDKEA